MKTRQTILYGLLAAMVALAFIACGDKPDLDDPTPQTETYSGTADGTTYTLTIDGDTYVLTVGTKTSSGTVVSYSNGTFTLKPDGSATTFTASVSSSGLTGFIGDITWEGDSTPTTLPTTVTPTPPPTTGNPLEGTWLEADGTTMTIAGNTITITSTYEGGTLFGSGTVTVNNNTITVNFTAGEQAGSTFTGTFSLSNNGNTLAMAIGGENTTWTKQGSPGGNPLEGTWFEEGGMIMTIAGNTFTLTHEGELEGSGTITVNNNTFTMIFTEGEMAGTTISCTFSLSNNGNTLTITTDDGTVVYTKQGSPGGNIAPFVLTGVQATDGDDNSTLTKDFHYIYSLGDRISDLIENPSVKLINGKVSISFDKPKNWNPQSGNLFFIGLTFTEEDNDEVILGYGRNGINANPGGGVLLIYTETTRILTKNDMLEFFPITSFFYENWETVNLNVSLQRGWNYMVTSYDDWDTVTITSGEPNSEFEWFVYVNDEDD